MIHIYILNNQSFRLTPVACRCHVTVLHSCRFTSDVELHERALKTGGYSRPIAVVGKISFFVLLVFTRPNVFANENCQNLTYQLYNVC